jgi:acetyl esterase/lipase
MGAAAYRRAQEFSWATILERMNRYYDEVLGRPSTTPSNACLVGDAYH